MVALAAHDLSRRQWQRRTALRIDRETLALVAVLFVFATLARMAPESAGFGDILPLASPAMAGLVFAGDVERGITFAVAALTAGRHRRAFAG